MSSATLDCLACNRTNARSARRCLWCGMPLVDALEPREVQPSSAEVLYLTGIDRLDDSAQVVISVSGAGIEIRELMPGTRRVVIPLESILSADVLHSVSRGNRRPNPWWRKLAISTRSKAVSEASFESKLKVTYCVDDEVFEAEFARNERDGKRILESVARTILYLRKHLIDETSTR